MKGKNYLRLFVFLALTGCLCLYSCITRTKQKNWSIEKDGGVRIVMQIQLPNEGIADNTIFEFIKGLRKRIEYFGVLPNIQKLDSLGKIQVDLPSMADPERTRKLLTQQGILEFWPTFDHSEIEAFFSRLKGPQKDLLNADNIYGPCMGVVKCEDTAEINKYLNMPEVKAALPEGLIPMWGMKPTDGDSSYFELIAIKDEGKDGKAPLDGGSIVDARVYNHRDQGRYAVIIKMSGEGSQIWKKMTEDNLGRNIANVLDGRVLYYPMVAGVIEGGSTEISCQFTPAEAADFAAILATGKLPAPAVILEEQIIEPSKAE